MQSKKIYIILFSGTAVIIGLMLLFDYQQQQHEKKIFFSSARVSPLGPGDNIDQLFLTANDLSISEKKAFINIYLKTARETPGTDKSEIRDKINELYNSILQRRINRTTSKQQDGFSVKPVPQ